MSTSVREIKYIVRHDPRPLKFMFRDPSEDKKRLSAVIGRMIPYRVGIEFECFGTLTGNLINNNKRYKKLVTKRSILFEQIIHDLNLVDFKEDKVNYTAVNESEGTLNEIRVSFKGTKQLNSLYNVCRLLNQYCKIPLEKGGIHIHIDISDLYKHNIRGGLIKDYLSDINALSRCAEIFEGYKGNYNPRKIGLRCKPCWINVSSKNTIEFRIGRLTFDYQTIIRWVIELSKFVSEVRSHFYNRSIKDIKTEICHTQEETIPSIHDNYQVEYDNERVMNLCTPRITNYQVI